MSPLTHRTFTHLRMLLAAAAPLALAACGSLYEDEVGQATGDVMASFDDASQGGAFASLERPIFHRTDGFMKPGLLDRTLDFLVPSAYAAECTNLSFSSCANGVMSKSAADCTYGRWTVNGTITLTFSDVACVMSAVNDTVTRTADFQITGPRGATLAVSSPGGGQKVTRTGATSFNYTVLGMERIATEANGKKLFDISTQTTADIGVTGTSRSDRVMNGGTLEVTHHLAGYTVDLTPDNVTWTTGCNCASSGSWTGTASGSVSGSFTVQITGCGTASVTSPSGTKQVSFDRCAALQ